MTDRHWLTDWQTLTYRQTDWLTDWLIDWLTDRLTNRQTDRPTDRHTHTHTQTHGQLSICFACTYTVHFIKFTCSKGIDNALKTPMCSSQTALRNLTSCFWAKGRITKQPNNASPNETAEYWDRKDAYLEKSEIKVLRNLQKISDDLNFVQK